MQASNPTQQKVNAHMIRLFNKQAYSIPSWNLLYSVVKDPQVDPTVIEKHQYAYELYWALKDLFKGDYNYWFEVLSVDESTHSIELAQVRHYFNKVGPNEKLRFNHEVDERLFKSAYEGKTLDELNFNPEVHKSIKLNKYKKERSLTKTLKEENDGSFDPIDEIFTEGGLEKKIDRLFAPIINANWEWDKPTFEEFVENLPKVNTNVELSLADFLTDEGQKLIPYIIKKYADSRRPSAGLVGCLFALHNLHLLTIDIEELVDGEATALHRALAQELGNIGTFSAMSGQLKAYTRTVDRKRLKYISTAKNEIIGFLKA